VVQLLTAFGARMSDAGNFQWPARLVAEEHAHFVLAQWLDIVQLWAPLRIAAGCRMHADSTTALRLGLVDPEQGGVSDMLAARATAASTTPWGLINPKQLENGDVVEEGGDDHQALAGLVHVPICPSTAQFVRAATSGWSASRHWLHHRCVRIAVHVVLLVSERLRQMEALPHLPPELWLLFARFLRRRDWPVMGTSLPVLVSTQEVVECI
jgi:hypothetical protein